MSAAVIGAKLGPYVPLLLLTVALLIGVPMAYRLWRETHEQDGPARETDLLSDLEQAYNAGKMDEAEFRRVRDLLIGGKGGIGGKVRPKPPRDEPGQVPAASREPPPAGEHDSSVPPP